MDQVMIRGEKLRADAMRTTGETPKDTAYWEGYRVGLVGISQHHAAFQASVGSPDLVRDARGRGYRDARLWIEGRSNG